MRSIYLNLAMVVSFLLLLGCNKEDDTVEPLNLEYGHIDLLETSLQKFPYENHVNEVIFVDNHNNQFSGSLSKEFISYTHSSSLEQVKNTTDQIQVSYYTKHYSRILSIPDLGIKINIAYYVSVDAYNYEELLISDVASIHSIPVINNQIGNHPGIFFVIDERTGPGDIPVVSNPLAETTINGRTFENVYYSNKDDQIEYYFSYEQGIVGFIHKQTGNSYSIL